MPSSKTRSKTPSNERAEKPLVRIGNHLSKLVIGTMACSIGALILFLAVMEWRVGDDIRQIYLKTSAEPGATPQHDNREHIADFLSLLATIRESSDKGATGQSINNSNPVLQEARNNGLVLNGDEAAIYCDIYPEGQDLNKTAPTSCELNIDQLQLSGMQHNQPDAATASAAAMLEHRNNLQQFWLQAAQLILLNLLLPLLTALFGYIFGRQQTERSSGERQR